ncbi:2-methylisocitrate lyase [Litchfieldella qijiaojingensis]|uniref:2-methylisocitrate lyase n=1 Tax=Litchfieldella qijiaojingensis TaxID=980347 RepID=A0ABQ2ZBW5_9GAMM|nr:isocitrate lyase/phosphoenolpyruvate mutase family protein [Halomonas qijiaojingensis]GGY11682.1 2-methylisocitrate lyase [Halomonas qijiaojingensis]
MHTQLAKAQRFRDLHTRSETFLMPNAWDPGSARMLASSGFSAIATTSAGIAFSLGLPDYEGAVSQAEMVDCIHRIARSVELPVSADLEAGYGTEPAHVAKTIELAVAAGAVGGNIEDFTGDASAPLYDLTLATERIRAARAAADASGIPFTLTARTDCYLTKMEKPFSEAVRRANRYREAGADCLFVPGASDPSTIAELVKEIDGPLTVVMGLRGLALSVSQLQDMGVRRVTIGGSLARATYGLIRKASQEMALHGTFEYSSQQIPDAELCAFFSGYADDR